MSDIHPDYQTHLLAIIVKPAGQPIFSETATIVRIESEGGGTFIEVEQSGNGLGKIAINPEEWPAIREAIDRMVAQCAEIDASSGEPA